MSTGPGPPASPEPATRRMAAKARHSGDALSAFARGPRSRWPRRGPFLALAVAALAVAGILIGLWGLRGNWRERGSGASREVPRREGRLVVESRPSGAQVEIDGQPRGVTPLAVVVPAGRHRLAVAAASRREIEAVVNAGTDVVYHVEMSEVVTSLRVETVPTGADVTVDGRRCGPSPLDLTDLPPGQHTVVVSSAEATVTRRVDLREGIANSVVIALAVSPGPAIGWLSVTAPIDLEIYDDRHLVGKGATARVLLIAGRHNVSLVNRELGYEDWRRVDIVANRTANVRVQPGTGSLYINAIPWAEVFLDGRRIGETPIGNFAAALGRHEILFRHPDLGEQRRTVVVTLTAPARVDVTFEQ